MKQCFKRAIALALVLLLIFSVGIPGQTFAEGEDTFQQSSGDTADKSPSSDNSLDKPDPDASQSGQSQEPDPDASQSGQSQEPDPDASQSGQ